MNKSLDFVILENEYLKVTLCKRGASIYRIRFNNEDMVMTTRDEKDFLRKDIYFGKTIGRVAGRIVVDGKIVLHGGDEGLSNQDFAYKKNGNLVEFYLLDKNTVEVQVKYTLDKSTLKVEYACSTKEKTLLCLTNHSYFCLGEKSNSNLEMKMNSDEYIVTDKNLIPTKFESTKQKYDFHNFKPVLVDGDIDNYFLLKDRKISLKSRKYLLNIDSDFEGTQIFTDHFDLGCLTLLTDEQTYRSVAIEPQDNQLNRKELLPNASYKRYIRYAFSKL